MRTLILVSFLEYWRDEGMKTVQGGRCEGVRERKSERKIKRGDRGGRREAGRERYLKSSLPLMTVEVIEWLTFFIFFNK